MEAHNQNKDDNKFKNKKQPELTENRTIWKSDNQGIKEETFIQTGRRGKEDSRQGSSWRTRAGKAVPGGLGEAVAYRLGGPTFVRR